jgi:hypothetical protein
MSNRKKSDKWVLTVVDEDQNGNAILRPYANYDNEMIGRLKNGARVRTNIAEVRNVPRHRLYRVMLRVVAKHNAFFTTEDALHKVLLVACGVTEPFISLEGDMTLIPSSTAFDAMDEVEFEPYFQKAQEVICEKIIPGLDLDALMEEARKEAGWEERKEAA